MGKILLFCGILSASLGILSNISKKTTNSTVETGLYKLAYGLILIGTIIMVKEAV